MQLINEGQREFAKDVYGMMKEEYLTITPLFDLQTNAAISLALNGGTATDICIAATHTVNATAGIVATQLVTALTAQTATATVTFASATWYFTITFDASVSAAVFDSPTTPGYIDAIGMLMGKSSTHTAPTCTGSLPEDCAVEASLPADCLYVYGVEWDGTKLEPAPLEDFWSPDYEGDPQSYAVYGNKLRLFPSPSEQKRLHLIYKYHASDWASLTQSASQMDYATDWHMAPLYYAGSLQAEMNFEDDIAKRLYARYMEQVRKYNRLEQNQKPGMFPKHETFIQPKVVFATSTY
jgi:hypothetical protein